MVKQYFLNLFNCQKLNDFFKKKEKKFKYKYC